ncbi:MAG TPA: hypothetical protein VGI79_09915 [Caulobacteraceae bacterium]|jgi:hypothetical protein
MTVETRTLERPVYLYPLISWGSVLAGAVVAIALGALFSVLGLAVGATAFNPFNLEHDAKMLTIGGGLWIVFANLVALQIGGFIAARSARFADHTNGMFQGLAVWAVTLIAAMLLAGPSLSAGFTGAADSAMDQASADAEHTALGDRTPATARADAGPTPAEMAQMAEAAKKTTEALAWWAFAAIAAGAVGAVAGGRIGADHPAWPDRPRQAAVIR